MPKIFPEFASRPARPSLTPKVGIWAFRIGAFGFSTYSTVNFRNPTHMVFVTFILVRKRHRSLESTNASADNVGDRRRPCRLRYGGVVLEPPQKVAFRDAQRKKESSRW